MPTLRTASLADAPALAAFAEGVFRDTFAAVNTVENMSAYCQETFGAALQAAELQGADRDTWLAEHDGELVGFVQLRWNTGVDGIVAPSAVQLHRIYVAAPWQGKGVAQRLLAASLEAARARQVSQLWLGVWEHNPRAIAFYTKLGFTEVGDLSFPLGSDLQRDVVFVRSTSDD